MFVAISSIPNSGPSPADIFRGAVVVFLAIIQIYACFILGTNRREITLNFLTASIGALLGIFLSYLVVPISAGQKNEFSSIATALGGIISGYIAGKIGAIFKYLVKDETVTVEWRLRVLLSLGTLLLFFMVSCFMRGVIDGHFWDT